MAGICELFERTGIAMSERTCGNCRWWRRLSDAKNNGECCRYPGVPVAEHFDRPTPSADWGCGEWADGSITPEQEERRELVRRFAVAIADGLARDAKMTAQETVEHIWRVAETLADAEPQIQREDGK